MSVRNSAASGHEQRPAPNIDGGRASDSPWDVEQNSSLLLLVEASLLLQLGRPTFLVPRRYTAARGVTLSAAITPHHQTFPRSQCPQNAARRVGRLPTVSGSVQCVVAHVQFCHSSHSKRACGRNAMLCNVLQPILDRSEWMLYN